MSLDVTDIVQDLVSRFFPCLMKGPRAGSHAFYAALQKTTIVDDVFHSAMIMAEERSYRR